MGSESSSRMTWRKAALKVGTDFFGWLCWAARCHVLPRHTCRWGTWLQGQRPRNDSSDTPIASSSTQLRSYKCKSVTQGIRRYPIRSGTLNCLLFIAFFSSIVSLTRWHNYSIPLSKYVIIGFLRDSCYFSHEMAVYQIKKAGAMRGDWSTNQDPQANQNPRCLLPSAGVQLLVLQFLGLNNNKKMCNSTSRPEFMCIKRNGLF